MGLQLPLLLIVDVPQLFLLIFWTMTHARFCSHAHRWLSGQQSPFVRDLLCCLGWNVFSYEFIDVFISLKQSF